MKQNLLKLMMFVGLIVVANTAFASGETSPFRGGTYPYQITGINLTGSATYTITYQTGSDVSFTPASGSLLASATTLSFSATYGAAASDGSIRVTIVYDGVNGCSNYLELPITPLASPTFVLGVAADNVNDCQEFPGGTSTSITYTVTPTTTAIGYTYTYTLAFSPANINGASYTLSATNGVQTGQSITVTNAASGPSVVTVTFNSTPGDAVALLADLAATPVMKTSATQGNYNVNGGANSPDQATTNIGSMPIMGSF